MQDTTAVPAPPVPVPRPGVRSGRTGGITFGVLLVVAGIVLLAVQVVPGASFAQLWPLLVIAVGLVQMLTPDGFGSWGGERVADGLGTVLIGVVLLGCTLGYVGWSMWLTLMGLWPVLLVSAGVKLLGKGLGQSWIALIAPVLIWAAVFYAAGTAWGGAFGLAPLPDLGIQAPITYTINGL